MVDLPAAPVRSGGGFAARRGDVLRVRAEQTSRGSRDANARRAATGRFVGALTADVITFIRARDSAYLARASAAALRVADLEASSTCSGARSTDRSGSKSSCPSQTISARRVHPRLGYHEPSLGNVAKRGHPRAAPVRCTFWNASFGHRQLSARGRRARKVCFRRAAQESRQAARHPERRWAGWQSGLGSATCNA